MTHDHLYFCTQDVMHWAYNINMVQQSKEFCKKFAKREAWYKEFRCKLLQICFIEKPLIP